jgi:hypothetical protein
VRLDLHDNPITSEFAPHLAAVLAAAPQLRALVLNDTSLGDDGVAAVCGALAAGAPGLEVSGGPARVVGTGLGAWPPLPRLLMEATGAWLLRVDGWPDQSLVWKGGGVRFRCLPCALAPLCRSWSWR